MSNKLNDEALDTLFRAARTFNGYVDEPVTEADIQEIYELVKMGRPQPTSSPHASSGCSARRRRTSLPGSPARTMRRRSRKRRRR
jgi:3-hydroxypropanoate dehydrogenase